MLKRERLINMLDLGLSKCDTEKTLHKFESDQKALAEEKEKEQAEEEAKKQKK